MLDKDTLKENLANGISTIVRPAIEECFKRMWPSKSNIGDSYAETFANNFDEMVSDQLAEVFAAAIDYYVRNIEINGYLMQVNPSPGSLQIYNIKSMSTPILNGAIPNTLGIR